MSQITLHLKFPLLSMIEEQSLGKYPTRLKRNNFIQGRPRRLYVVPPRNLHKRNICRAVSGYCPPSFKAKNQDFFLHFGRDQKQRTGYSARKFLTFVFLRWIFVAVIIDVSQLSHWQFLTFQSIYSLLSIFLPNRK